MMLVNRVINDQNIKIFVAYINEFNEHLRNNVDSQYLIKLQFLILHI